MPKRNHNYINDTMELLATSKNAFIRALKRGFGFRPIHAKADPTQTEIDKLRNQADKLKAHFEKKLKPVFNKWQAAVIQGFKQQLIDAAPVLLIPIELREELVKILTNHYQEVAAAFVPGTSFIAVKQVQENPIDAPAEGENDNEDDFFLDLVLDDIEQDIQEGVAVNLPVHAGSIINTTEQIGNNARSESFEDDGDLDVFGAAAIMSARMAGRSTTVAVTETEWISQYSENVAIETTSPLAATATENQLKDLQGVSPNVRLKTTDIATFFAIGTVGEIDLFRRQLTNPQKMWATMGDKKVRTTHRVMEGETIGINQAFQLAGGLMMYPTDSSLGASFSEIVGCRCHLFYF